MPLATQQQRRSPRWGAEKAECIFLNDFRWSPEVITWHDFPFMREGQQVHLHATKTTTPTIFIRERQSNLRNW